MVTKGSNIVKASVTNGYGQGFVLEEIEIAEPIGAEVLAEVKASGLCRSDLSIQEDGLGIYELPAVLGHEAAGEVIAVGPDVTAFSVGDHVVGCLVQMCGRCANCLTGLGTLCVNPGETLRSATEPARLLRGGVPLHQCFGLGGFAQQMLVHQHQLVALPKDMPWPQAALLGCGVVTGAGAVLNRARIRPGQSAVIVGAGGVGLNGVNAAVVAGANPIIVVDVEDAKLAVATAFGATHTVNSRSVDAVAAVKAITDGGADHVFDYVGHSAVLQASYAMVGRGGGLYLVGASVEGALTVGVMETEGYSKSVHGVVMGQTVPVRDIPLYTGLYQFGRFKLDELVTAKIALSQVAEGYEMLRDPATIRVVITDFEN